MILVTGATGSIGRYLVRDLRRRGEPFRVLVRDPARGAETGGEVAVGDFDDPDSVAAAMVGVDRLLLNAGGAQPASGPQPMIRQQRTVIDAAVLAGVSGVVKVSVWGASQGGRLAEGAHWEIEEYLRASGLAWVMLQPSGFMQNFLTGAGAFTEDGNLLGAYGDAGISYIDCRDIAAVAAVALTGARWGESHVLTGPVALSHTEIAGKVSAATGRSVRYRDLPPAEFAARLVAQGLPAGFAEDVAALYAGVAGGALEATTGTVRELTGRAPRTFDEFLADNLAALRAALPE